MSECASFTILGNWKGKQITEAVKHVAGGAYRWHADGSIGRANPYPYKSLMVIVGDADGSDLHSAIRPDGEYTILSAIVYTQWNRETYLVRYGQEEIDEAAEELLRAIETELNRGIAPLS